MTFKDLGICLRAAWMYIYYQTVLFRPKWGPKGVHFEGSKQPPRMSPQQNHKETPWLQNGSEKGSPRKGVIPHETLCRASLQKGSDKDPAWRHTRKGPEQEGPKIGSQKGSILGSKKRTQRYTNICCKTCVF